MTTQRADYLRRAVPLLGKNRCPRCRKAALVTDQIDVSSVFDVARGITQTIPGRTYCPSCRYDATGDRR